MRPKLQKQSALKFVGRIIQHTQDIKHRSLLRNQFPKLALGFIPVIVDMVKKVFLCQGGAQGSERRGKSF